MHKDSVFAYILSENGEKNHQKCDVLTCDLDSLRDFLVEKCVGWVAMEH